MLDAVWFERRRWRLSSCEKSALRSFQQTACSLRSLADARPPLNPFVSYGESYPYSPTTASASTSTTYSGPMRLDTSTIVEAGRTSPKNSRRGPRRWSPSRRRRRRTSGFEPRPRDDRRRPRWRRRRFPVLCGSVAPGRRVRRGRHLRRSPSSPTRGFGHRRTLLASSRPSVPTRCPSRCGCVPYASPWRRPHNSDATELKALNGFPRNARI